MRRFAADGARRVLYYEERRKGSIVLAAIGMPEDGIPIDFAIEPIFLIERGADADILYIFENQLPTHCFFVYLQKLSAIRFAINKHLIQSL